MENFDLALLDRWVHHRDAEAFSELVKRHAAMVYGVCRRILRNEADAQDAAQDCFAELLRMSPDASPVKTSLGGWLHTLATHRALDRLRSDARRVGRETGFAKGMASNREEADLDDIQGYVDEAIADLPPKLRDPVVRHFLEGLSHREIADATGIARRTVSSRITKGIDDVRAHLERRGVTITSSALASLLTVEAAQAVPVALRAALGRFALSEGVVATSAKAGGAAEILGHIGVLGGIVMTGKKIAFVVVLALVIALGLFWTSKPSEETPGSAVQDRLLLEVPASVLAMEENEPLMNETPVVVVAEDTVHAVAVAADAERSSDQKEEANVPGPLTISGYTVDELGQPVADASVVIVFSVDVNGITRKSGNHTIAQPENQYRTTADFRGRFTVRGIRHRGWAGIYADAHGLQGKGEVDLSDGESFEHVEVRLKEGLSILGRVIASNGEPVSGATVDDLGMLSEMGEIDRVFAVCNERGEFQIIVSDSTIATLMVRSSRGSAVFENLSISPDQFVELRLPEYATVIGHVSYGTGKPAEGIQVLLHSPLTASHGPRKIHLVGTGLQYEAETDAQGYYEIPDVFPDTRHQIRVRGNAGSNIAPTKPLGPVAEGQVLRRDIVLQELTTIRGMVVARSDGFPIPRARVCVAEGLEYASYLRAEERSTIANDDGTFEFQVALQPGEYYLVPYYDGASWTAAAKTFAETVRLEYGETLETTLELDPPYSIALRVVDRSGAPISNAYVAPTWSMVDISVGFWTGWSTDTDGRFSRNGFAPMGAYSLDIHASGYLPTNSSDYEGRSGEVFPEETIVLYETARAEGLVIDANGDLVAWANLDVQATFEDGREFTFDVDTNGQGYFLTEENLPATTATLDVVIWQDRESSSPPRTWRSDPISFEAGLIHDLGTITLEASDEEE